jgi:hypothetical protein
MINNFIQIPTWDSGSWTTTTFQTRDLFRDYVDTLFKEPGKYQFNEVSYVFNEQASLYHSQSNVYCLSPFRSKDYIAYWDDQKEKCRKGVIYKDGKYQWYLPREYYMWLNFLPIFNKEKKLFSFPDVRDTQYHLSLYELRAELHYKHASLLKKRQMASSYYHCAKLINQLWFEEGVVLKIGASLKDYINVEGIWKFLDEYRSFLNEKTAWVRPMNPGKVLGWQQKIEVEENGRKIDKGLKGVLQGVTFEQSPTKGVGGPTSIFYYEEAGIAPTLDKTFEYMRPALQSGDITTGLFIAAGSVGDLDHCKPLKELTYYPERNDILAVETNLLDENGTYGKTGLFIPEQWGMPPYIDQYGNSQVEDALKALDNKFERWKK